MPVTLRVRELVDWMEREGKAGRDLKLHAPELVRLTERWRDMEAWLSKLNPGLFPPRPGQRLPDSSDIMD